MAGPLSGVLGPTDSHGPVSPTEARGVKLSAKPGHEVVNFINASPTRERVPDHCFRGDMGIDWS